MYSTCLFCHAKLGSNEAVEHFPVGRRLAFDADKGRLWVICRRCERWNLTPIEERWEAIEECERAFRTTKLRISTENIGLARIAEGLELVRIGKPQRPEMAAWRYGDQFARRRKRYFALGAASVGAFASVWLAAPAVFGLDPGSSRAAVLAALTTPHAVNFGVNLYRARKLRTRLKIDGMDELLVVPPNQHKRVTLISDHNPAGWALFVPIRRGLLSGVDPSFIDRSGEVHVHWDRITGHAIFFGAAALRAAGQLLPKINRSGATKADVQVAVSYLDHADNPQALFGREFARSRSRGKFGDGALADYPAHVRLALEMITHEDVERRALEGELALLENVWRDAEEIAGISDNLLLSPRIGAWLSGRGDRE